MLPQLGQQAGLRVDGLDVSLLVLAVVLHGKHLLGGQVRAEVDGAKTSSGIGSVRGVVVAALEVVGVLAHRQDVLLVTEREEERERESEREMRKIER